MKTYRVGYLVGSLSSTSINRTLSKALIRLAPRDLELVEVSIGNLLAGRSPLARHGIAGARL